MELDNIHKDYREEVITREAAQRENEKLRLELEEAYTYRHELMKRMAPRVNTYMKGYYRAKVEDGVFLSDVDLHNLNPVLLERLRNKARVDLEM